MRRMGKRRRARPLWMLFIFLLTAVIVAALIDHQLRPIVRKMASNQAQIIATRMINDAVMRLLSEENITYESLIRLNTDENQRITSLETNVGQINLLKTQVAEVVLKTVEEYDEAAVQVPFGNLLNSEFLMGRGPKIPIRFNLTGTVQPEIESEFSSAGINQTYHRITLRIPAKLYVIIPGFDTAAEINTECLVAETVIVGIVPETYLKADGLTLFSGTAAGNQE